MPHSRSALLAAPRAVSGKDHGDRAHAWLEEHYRGPTTATVAEAALDVGCTHLGRFAASYRERFGELPSQTL